MQVANTSSSASPIQTAVDAQGRVRATASSPSHAAVLGPYDPALDLSIVILNWNTLELLRACLTSIQQNAGAVHYEVIVVDNGSHDGSVEIVSREFPDVLLLTNAENKGFAAANNQGLGHARGRYLLLLNCDTTVLPDALPEMMRYMDAHPHVGVVGPHLLNGDGSTQLSVFPFPHVLQDVLVILEINRWPLVKRLARWYGRRRDTAMTARTGEVDYVLGACMCFRREALLQVGVLDAAYFFGGEDMDICYRLRKHHWPTVYLTSSRIIHLHGGSRRSLSASYLMWYYAGKLRFFNLYHPRWQYAALRAAVAVTSIGHLLALFVGDRRSPRSRSLLSAYAHLLARAVAP